MMQLTCQAVLFDLDGVLADSMENVERHWRRWAERNGLDADSIMGVVHGRPARDSIRELAPEADQEAEFRWLEQAEADDTEGVKPIAGAGELMAQVPVGRMGVVTSGSDPVARARLGHVGLTPPPVWVTADDITRGKPDPEPYQLGAEKLGVGAAQCVVIEDSPAGIRAGQAAGAPVIAVLTSHSVEAVGFADAVVASLNDIQVQEDGTGSLVITLRTVSPQLIASSSNSV